MNAAQLPLRVGLRDECTLENFYPGPNAAALSSVTAVAQAEVGWGAGPIYLWGASGVGRSHLLQAACVSRQVRDKTAAYLPLIDWQAYHPSVLEGLEACTLVCLDDVDAIAEQSIWEEALFALFHRVQEADSSLLLSAGVAPRALSFVLQDLRSRYSQALIFQLHELSEPEKCAALQKRAAVRGLVLSDEVARFILHREARSTERLFALLDSLDQASLQAQRRLTIPFLKATLGW